MVRLTKVERQAMSQGDGDMTDQWWTRIREQVAALPDASALSPAAVAERFGGRDAWRVRAGQVWRAAADDVTTLVYLTGVSDGSVDAVPVTVGTAQASAGSVIVGPDLTAFGASLAVWLPSARSLGWGALDGLLDDWTGRLATWMTSPASTPAPSGCRLEREDAPLLSSAWDEFADAAADLAELAAEFPVPTAGPDTVGGLPLSRLRPSELAEWLGVSIADAQNLRRGHFDPTEAQLSIIAAKTGQTPAVASTVPREMFIAASDPHYRDVIDVLMTMWGTSTAATQRRLAQGAYALAARASGGPGAVQRAHIDAYIQSELAGRQGAQ